ncbi:MAG: aminotransferase class III-fold pyridoxal phosphate-dependent enzyme [Candidatus Omnitrophica bacterium]|nr:aminotransferase class III-fold pyridoxal phosphate-dependent enzyme [Candidatus Omnitrophota bacterium]
MKNMNSLIMQKKARQVIPGMSQLLSKRPDMFSLGVWPAYYSKAEGAKVWDLDGNEFIDMSIGGIGANVLGYADPQVNAAVVEAINNGSSSSLNCPEEVELAEELCRMHPWAQMARFARSGGESMAIAVRIARAHTGRDTVIICGYHGWHDWYLAANVGTENALGEHLIPGLSPTGVPKALKGTTLVFRYNDIESLEKVLLKNKDKVAAIVMEPVRNVSPEKGFLQGVRKLADQAGAVFIFDEISSGFRMNCGGAHLLYGVDPDMAVFSKALGNGYPIAAIIGRASVMESAQKSFISSTMWTERVGPSAALAMIKKFRAVKAHEHLMTMGRLIQEGWAVSGEHHGLKVKVSGIYPLSHFSFDDEDFLLMKAFFVQEMLEKGFLASNLFYPMLAHTREQADSYLLAVDEVFGQIKKLKISGGLRAALQGEPSVSGFKRIT